ncbi:MAG: hypothetical protein PUA93_04345 [Eubacteriales bacterium]|nr:hypothetical protein [Eubacteriales bacterium]
MEEQKTTGEIIEVAPQDEEKSGVTFGQICHMIIKHWVAWVVFMFVGLAGGFGFAQYVKKPNYSSTAVMMISGSNISTSADIATNLNTAYNQANIAVTMMNTQIVYQKVTETLATTYTDLKTTDGYDYKTINKAYSATLAASGNTNSSIFINITAQTSDKQFSQDIANTVASTAISIANNNADYSYLKGSLIVTSPASEATDTSMSKAVVTLIGLLIGVIVGALYGVIYEFADNKVTSKVELENLTHVKVIGMIPDFRRDKGSNSANNTNKPATDKKENENHASK